MFNRQISSDKQTKVTPEVFQAITMDEIAGLLSDIKEMLGNRVSTGELIPMQVSVTATPSEIVMGPWIRISLYNRGTGDVYFSFHPNPSLNTDDPIKANESLDIDLGERKRKPFYLVCPVGQTATVGVKILL